MAHEESPLVKSQNEQILLLLNQNVSTSGLAAECVNVRVSQRLLVGPDTHLGRSSESNVYFHTQADELIEVFDLMDIDGDGKFTADELLEALQFQTLEPRAAEKHARLVFKNLEKLLRRVVSRDDGA